jgi:bifunctional non-homologous end joining protein LigD
VRWRNSSTRVIASSSFIAPALPTDAAKAPRGELWLYEIKHDGYRLLVRKAAGKVRIFTRRGRLDASVSGDCEAALRIRAKSFYLDNGEGVACREDGVAIFDHLHSKAFDHACFLYAFDLLELEGEDWRARPLEERKAGLRRLLRNRKSGIVYNDHLEGDGAAIFEHACRMGLEGIVAKRRDMAYRSGRVKSWLKIKNPKSPAALRVEEGTF